MVRVEKLTNWVELGWVHKYITFELSWVWCGFQPISRAMTLVELNIFKIFLAFFFFLTRTEPVFIESHITLAAKIAGVTSSDKATMGLFGSEN